MKACLETCWSAVRSGLADFVHDVASIVHHAFASDHDDDALVKASVLLHCVEIDHLVVEHKVHHAVALAFAVVEHEVLPSLDSAQALRRRASKKPLFGNSRGDGQSNHSIYVVLVVGLAQ